jgi:hypothetical protein
VQVVVNIVGCEMLLGSRVGFRMAQPVLPAPGNLNRQSLVPQCPDQGVVLWDRNQDWHRGYRSISTEILYSRPLFPLNKR